MNLRSIRSRSIAVLACAMGLAATSPVAAAEADLLKRIEALERGAAAQKAENAKLAHELMIQKAIEDVRNLQFTYNYYNTSRLYGQVADLISENAGTIEIAGRGVYKGKAGFLKNFHPGPDGKPYDSGVKFGYVLSQLAGMDVIHVAQDGLSARSRVRVSTSVYPSYPDTKPHFNGGDYEMEYVKEHGQWFIKSFKYVHNYSVTYENVVVTPGYSEGPDGKADAPTTWYHPWPETGNLAFHFPNPITGKYPPDVTGKQQYWIGNWPGEYGKTGHK